MNKTSLFLKKSKKIFLLCMVFVLITSSLVGCGTKESPFKQSFEASGYKKLAVYKGYNTTYQDFEQFEKGHGYLSIESEDGGNTILFKGFYQIKSVHIGTQDLTQAFKTNTVEEFAKLCGYKEYEDLANNPLFKCTSNEILNYNDYIVYFEPLETGGADLYLGKKFEFTLENNGDATATYNRIMELLSSDSYDQFSYEELKDEYGNLTKHQSFKYALVLGLNESEGGNAVKRNFLVGETKYTYNFYSEMENLLFSLDKEFATIVEQSKNNTTTQTPVF